MVLRQYELVDRVLAYDPNADEALRFHFSKGLHLPSHLFCDPHMNDKLRQLAEGVLRHAKFFQVLKACFVQLKEGSHMH